MNPGGTCLASNDDRPDRWEGDLCSLVQGLRVEAGTVVVGEPQAYSGRTVVAGGTLRLGGAPALPVAGSRLWLDAGTLDGASPVATWPDSSGNARNATQATAASQPLSTTSALNIPPLPRMPAARPHLPAEQAFAHGSAAFTPPSPCRGDREFQSALGG